jgi:RNA polymerase sigma-70 factor (ECF subfamily)
MDAGEPTSKTWAQEIAAQCWRAFPGYDPARAFSTWLYRIRAHVAISWLAPRRRAAIAPCRSRWSCTTRPVNTNR